MEKTVEINAQKLSDLETTNNGYTYNFYLTFEPLGLNEAVLDLYHTTNVVRFLQKLSTLPGNAQNVILAFFDDQKSYATLEKWLRLLALRQALLIRTHYSLHGLALPDDVGEDVMKITGEDLSVAHMKGNKDLIEHLFVRIRKEYLATQIHA